MDENVQGKFVHPLKTLPHLESNNMSREGTKIEREDLMLYSYCGRTTLEP